MAQQGKLSYLNNTLNEYAILNILFYTEYTITTLLTTTINFMFVFMNKLMFNSPLEIFYRTFMSLLVD